MRRGFAYLLVLGLVTAPVALAQDDGGTRLERLIEEQLSRLGRSVTVRGFRGALTGRAELSSLTIADADGVWLTLTDAVLDWNRAALLRGRLEVEELTAARIEIPRRPLAEEPAAPSPEASGTGLTLPELPVAIRIGRIAGEVVDLGPDILGQALEVSAEGALRLEDGEGEADIDLNRIDATRGEIAIAASFSNATGLLAVDALFDEGEGGIVAGALGIPGAPELRLTVVGEGPINDFAADIALAADGVDRVAGRVATQANDAGRQLTAVLSGDMRALVEEEFWPFFGDAARLDLSASRDGAGATAIERLFIETASLRLEGSAALNAEGGVEGFSLEGELADPAGGTLTLPVADGAAEIARAALNLSFDAAQGEAWRGVVTVADLQQGDIEAASLRLDGGGVIGADGRSATATFDFEAESLDFGNSGAQSAIGERVVGRAEIAWEEGLPLAIDTLEVSGESYRAALEGSVASFSTTLDLDGSARIEASDISRFSGLAGRPLAGALDATLVGSGGVLSGLADLSLTGIGADLATGDARLDPYLAGDLGLEIRLRRTTAGLFLDRANLRGDQADLSARLALQSGQGEAAADARLAEIGPLFEGLSGPAEVEFFAAMEDGVWTYDLLADAMAARLSGTGTAEDVVGVPRLTFAGRLDADDLARFAEIAGRPVGGRLGTDLALRFESAENALSLDAEGEGIDLVAGIPQADALLAGRTDFAISAAQRPGDIELTRLEVRSAQASVAGTARIAPGPAYTGEVNARLNDLGTVLPNLSGPATLAAALLPGAQADGFDYTLNLTLPNGSAASAGTLGELETTPKVDGTLDVDISDLSPYGAFLGRDLGGRAALTGAGQVTADLKAFDVALEANTQDLRTGIAPLDRLLAGSGRLLFEGSRAGDEIDIEAADLRTALLTLSASGTTGVATDFTFDGRLADIAPFAPGFSGPLSANGTAQSAGAGRAAIDARVTGPAGAEANVSGDLAEDGSDADLRLTGRAPLGLVNGVIAPQAASGLAAFDLSVRGQPGLDALAGGISVEGAELVAPLLGIALDDLSAAVNLNRGLAALDMRARVRDGGRVTVTGPVGLTDRNNAELSIDLDEVVLTDPTLYRTELDARLGVNGPLAGGAAISGRIDVGTTEVLVPSGGGGSAGGLPEITHIGEPPASRATRDRAGLIDRGGPGGGGAGPAYDVDLTISAPRQIFVRGRGLDAELGGLLRLTGTTANLVPSGQFDLLRGRLDILGRRLDLTQGSVALTGAFDPRIRLIAETEADDVDIEIAVEGSPSDPEVSFSSRPDLPEDEILARLIFGRGIETLSPLQIARLASAVATLGSSGGGALGAVRSGAGLADLDVTTGDDGGAAVRAGAYLAENVYTDVTVDTEGDAVINLNLDVSRSLTVRGSTSNSGDSGLGVFFERDY
ncbi:MAG: translocation/assembly module TamB domain-containing protein [Pseudomonadota bacterium]